MDLPAIRQAATLKEIEQQKTKNAEKHVFWGYGRGRHQV
jgi:hypothetical protein